MNKFFPFLKMVLYATDLVELEKPKTVKTKRVSKKKVEPVIEEPKVIEAPPKPKRQRAPRKKVEPKEEIKEAQEEVKEPELPLLLKEAPPKKTRKRKQIEVEEPVKEAEQTEQVCESPTLAEEPEKPKKTRKIKPKTESKASQSSTEPPVWFQKFVQGAEKEKAQSVGQVTKKQEKVIKTEALKTAHKSWQSGVTRDRVQGEVDSHMNRMYQMIFSGR
jgi:chromosomal replication initiation ATPase DnaA